MACLLVQTGQCGNQLGYQLLADLFNQIHHRNGNYSQGLGDEAEDIIEDELDMYFREAEGKPGKYYARCVCLDTEPKVINDVVSSAKSSPSVRPVTASSSSATANKRAHGKASNEIKSISTRRWIFDNASVAYRHGGAGNNWAVGYDMCSGDYLELCLDCIRRELDKSFRPIHTILIIHGVAGGTGSGLGTRITEEIADAFSGSVQSIVNLAITPYHFGEVVVQHYNALLCLSKVAAASDGVLLFENEVAQELCKYMRRLDRPTLHDINKVISSNIVPLLVPKHDHSSGHAQSLADDIQHLCPHPGYKFLDVKMTPQTSESAVNFTYDSWNALISTLTKMQIRGTASERGLGSVRLFDVDRSSYHTTSSPASSSSSSSSSSSAAAAVNNYSCKNVASVLTLFGDDAEAVADNMSFNKTAMGGAGGGENESFMSSPRSAAGGDAGGILPPPEPQLPGGSLRTFFLAPYVGNFHQDHVAVRSCVSEHTHINGYRRSVSLLSNGCSTLPLLNRVCHKASQLFEQNAFLHVYARHGVERQDFVEAFQNMGQIIVNYNDL